MLMLHFLNRSNIKATHSFYLGSSSTSSSVSFVPTQGSVMEIELPLLQKPDNVTGSIEAVRQFGLAPSVAITSLFGRILLNLPL